MERKKRSKGSVWEFCYANKIFGTYGFEIRACGQKLVKFCAHTHTTAAKLVVRITSRYFHILYIFRRFILTTNLAAVVCGCVSVCKIWPISACTLSFRIQTFRKFCSHSKIPIRCLWTAFCVPLSFIFYEKQWFRMQIVTLRRSRSPLCGR